MTNRVHIILCLFLLSVYFRIVICSDLDLQSTHRKLITAYDRRHPSYKNSSVILPHYHGKRCAKQQLQFTKEEFLQNKYIDYCKEQYCLVQSACLGSDSIGNYLGDYFENIMCAKYSQVNYFAVAKVWEPKMHDEPSPFIASLPSIIRFYENQNTLSNAKEKMIKYCNCLSSCHEKENVLWIHGIKFIRKLLIAAMNYHLVATKTSSTIIRADDLIHSPLSLPSLPLFPDVAIHYRCGDNFVGYYGFLPFQQLIQRIPSDSKTIYILSESRSRKTSQRSNAVAICNNIFQSLFKLLKLHYPHAIILVRRGGDLYADMARLSYAKVLICSISTFCLWPAVASNGTAYFPKTKLILNGNTNIQGLGFHWIEEPHILLGAGIERLNPANVVSLLSRGVSRNGQSRD